GAEYDAESVRFEIGERSGAHVTADVRDRVLAIGIDAANQRAAIRFSGGEHRLTDHIGRRRAYVRVGTGRLRKRLPILDTSAEAADLDMRRDRQDARAQLLLEAVHHRQYD